MPAKADEKDAIRCTSCKKILGKGVINDGKIEIKCKCGTLNTIQAELPKQPAEPGNYIHNRPYQDRMDLVKKD